MSRARLLALTCVSTAILVVSAVTATSVAASVTAVSTTITNNPSLTAQQVSLSADATSSCSVTGYSWDFGDGTSSSSTNPTVVHAWATAGSFAVVVTVTDSCGAVAASTYSQVVKVDQPPTASFTAAVSGNVVYADPSATYDDDFIPSGTGTDIARLFWDFGDDTTSGGDPGMYIISHTYNYPGTYTITEYAFDTAENMSSTTRIVTVGNAPSPAFVEDDWRPIIYLGSWDVGTCLSASCSPNHTVRYSKAKGSHAYFDFTGAQITWIASRGPRGGTARVYIDNVFKGMVNLYASVAKDGVAVYRSPVMFNRTHTFRLQLSANERVNVDAFRIAQ